MEMLVLRSFSFFLYLGLTSLPQCLSWFLSLCPPLLCVCVSPLLSLTTLNSYNYS